MVKLFTILLALMVTISFGGMTFASSGFGDNSSIQSTLPLGTDDKGDDKDKKEGDEKKADDKGDDKGDDKEKDKEGK